MALKPKTVDFTVVPDEFPDSEIIAAIDVDWPKYTVASAGEKRTIKVTHIASGKEIQNTVEVKNEETGETEKVKEPFKTRSDFWGRSKKTIGGWLQEANKNSKNPATREDFLVEDVQTPDKLENVLHSAKSVVLTALKGLKTDNYVAVIGEGDSFRVGLSTLMEYKGNRKNLAKPVYLNDVSEYLKSRFKAEVVSGIEADDKLVMLAYANKDMVIVGEDKDYRGQPVKFYDVNNPDEGVINGDCFGELRVKEMKSGKKITGFGRIFMYWQIITGDSSDNYKANCMSDVQWADMSGYEALKDCKDDKEALEVVVNTFKLLYPEPKEVETWRGNKITIDWYYVANEMFQMARMLRWEGDFISFDQWCAEYGVSW